MQPLSHPRGQMSLSRSRQLSLMTGTISISHRCTNHHQALMLIINNADGSILADEDCWEGWRSILACSLVAVETDS